MDNPEDFIPEEIYAQNQYLVEDLRNLYGSGNKTRQPLMSMRERLQQNSTIPHIRDADAEWVIPIKAQRTRGNTAMKNAAYRVQKSHSWQQRFGTLAAIFFTTLLIGSLLMLISRVQQVRTGGPWVPGQTTGQGTTTLNFVSFHAPKGWRLLAYMSNDGGSDAPSFSNGVSIRPDFSWSVLFDCFGSGEFSLQITLNSATTQNSLPPMITKIVSCDSYVLHSTQIFPKSLSSVYDTEVKVITPGRMIYHVVIIQCINTKQDCTLLAPPHH